jgi:hypothetical protein
MDVLETCEVCGVPLMVSREFKWESNGIIGMTLSPVGRAVFYESEIIDNLFRGVERILGRSIWHIVIESRRRDVRKYMENIFKSQSKLWRETRKFQRGQQALDMRKADITQVNEVGRIYGYGDISLSDLWGREDYPWRTQVIRNPYSMYLYPAELLGSIEALEQIDLRVKYREIGENTYEVTTYPGRHPVALKGRLRQKRYAYKPGDLEWEVCEGCGVPKEIAACEWLLDEGSIIDKTTNRRMAIFGPWAIDAVLDDLEKELGSSVQEMVIEALRRFLKSTTFEESWRKEAADFRRLVAMRGLGNLVYFDGDRNSLTVTIENACMPLLMVGTMQGLFEVAMGVKKSTYEWELKDDGDLTITVQTTT